MALIETDPNLGAQIVADAKEYVLYSWSVQSAINPIAVAGAEGRHFWDYDGKRYLDFASQLVNVNIGHQHPKIIQAIKEQADKLCTIGPPMANESRSRLGRMLAEVTPGDLSVSFFTNGGAEANENAIKLARLATGRHKIIARYRSYHGATNGAVTLTGDPRRWAVEPGMPGVVRMFDPYTVPLPGGPPRPVPGLHRRAAPGGDPRLRGAAHRRRRHPRDGHGHERVIPPPDGYLQSIREVCDRHGILLILDEVMAGFGRTGQVVRVRALGRRARHPHRREGDQLGLRAARRDDRPRRAGRPGARHVLPRRAHLRGPPARLRVGGRLDRGVPGGGRSSRTPPRWATTSQSALDGLAGQPSVDRRRARARLLLGGRAREEPGDARDARPVQRSRRGGGAGRPAREGGARAGPLSDDATGTSSWSSRR